MRADGDVDGRPPALGRCATCAVSGLAREAVETGVDSGASWENEACSVATTLAPREVREIVHVPVDAEGPIERHGALII